MSRLKSFYILPLAAAAIALSGCAVAEFHPYAGAQRAWRTSPGAFIDTRYALPTYYGFPPRPYAVLGSLRATTAPIRANGVVSFAARRAKELGADAIIVVRKGYQYAGTMSFASVSGDGFSAFGSGFSAPLFLSKASILAIKWVESGLWVSLRPPEFLIRVPGAGVRPRGTVDFSQGL